MLKRFFLFVFLLFLASCGSKKQVTKSTTVKDSTYTVTKLVPRDTLVKVPGDSLKLKVPFFDIPEGKTLNYTSNSGQLSARLTRKGNELSIDCLFDELELQLEILDKIIQINREKTITHQETISIPERYIPWYVEILAWIGGVILLIAIIYVGSLVAVKYLKPF